MVIAAKLYRLDPKYPPENIFHIIHVGLMYCNQRDDVKWIDIYRFKNSNLKIYVNVQDNLWTTSEWHFLKTSVESARPVWLQLCRKPIGIRL